ncbi:hypothetical protein LOC67_02295 [Stieleria sp. JC731]|uniref:hypothetical protein n=2 Tax=Pirellulaceae TaxID=2691357 RepID=UPI001E5BA5A0|nr:hypothetical protein [Stieleria sp. JC731]MCC9599374.1 hypothetical protein [Stieleria sp. JC731]
MNRQQLITQAKMVESMSQSNVIDANELARLKVERQSTLVPEMHSWIVAGMVSAAARFIPVPFVDDFVKAKCRKHIVSSTLARQSRSELLNDFDAMYNDPGGILSGAAAMVARIPIKLLLFPVRKAVAIMTSVRGVPLELIRCILLGRTVKRYATMASRPDDKQLREAFDKAFSGMDFRVVRAVVGDALSGMDRWSEAAIKMAKAIAAQKSDDPLSQREESPVRKGAEQVEHSLNQPKVLDLFSDFDTKLDARLAALSTS